MFKKLSSIFIAGAMCVGMCTSVGAVGDEIGVFSFGDGYIPQSLSQYIGEDVAFYNSDFYLKQSNNSTKIKQIISSKKDIIIDSNGGSEFIDVFAQLKDNTFINITNDVMVTSTNAAVATWDQGRIFAEGKGNCTLKIKYNNMNTKVNVTVKNQIDILSIIKDSQISMENLNINELNTISNQNSIAIQSISSSDRINMCSIGYDMVTMTWTPTQNLNAWYNNVFKANVKQTGMPYTQSAQQTNKQQFYNSMVYSDFYTGSDPNYGNDCSGFVSICWGISRTTTVSFREGIRTGTYPKVGSYDYYSPDSVDLHNSYQYMQAGDALVKEGHVFLVAANKPSETRVYVYEQTPLKARACYWYYSSLQSGKYMPFSKG